MKSRELAVSQEQGLDLLRQCGAVLDGHFLLSSGLHSGSYYQCAKIFERPETGEAIARAIAARCRMWHAETVLSPALGGVLFGYELSRALGCRNIYAERPTGQFELRRGFQLRPGERVLIAENVVTTGGSVVETAQMAKKLGADVVGYAVVVDRSCGRFAPSEPLVTYVSTDAETFEKEECPQCRGHQPLVKPGSRVQPGAPVA